jgi:hypothetical protein
MLRFYRFNQIPCTDVFIGTPGSYYPAVHFSPNVNSDDAFVVKFSSTGSRLWGTYIGTNDDYGSSLHNGLYCATDSERECIYSGYHR